jgi:O-antigen ligase
LQKVWDTYVGTRIQEAHNGYIEVYLNLGWFGVALLGGLIVTGYRNVILMLRRNPEAAGLGLAFVIAAVLYSLTEAGFRMMSPIWFAFLLAITAAPVVAAKKVRPFPSPAALSTPLSASHDLDDMLRAESRKEIMYK